MRWETCFSLARAIEDTRSAATANEHVLSIAKMSPAEQFDIAFKIAENIGLILMPKNALNVLNEIASNRRRQIAKGFDAAHDDKHEDRSLLSAAMHCLSNRYLSPWQDWRRSGDYRTDLIDAASFIIAEIERWDRMPVKYDEVNHD